MEERTVLTAVEQATLRAQNNIFSSEETPTTKQDILLFLSNKFSTPAKTKAASKYLIQIAGNNCKLAKKLIQHSTAKELPGKKQVIADTLSGIIIDANDAQESLLPVEFNTLLEQNNIFNDEDDATQHAILEMLFKKFSTHKKRLDAAIQFLLKKTKNQSPLADALIQCQLCERVTTLKERIEYTESPTLFQSSLFRHLETAGLEVPPKKSININALIKETISREDNNKISRPLSIYLFEIFSQNLNTLRKNPALTQKLWSGKIVRDMILTFILQHLRNADLSGSSERLANVPTIAFNFLKAIFPDAPETAKASPEEVEKIFNTLILNGTFITYNESGVSLQSAGSPFSPLSEKMATHRNATSVGKLSNNDFAGLSPDARKAVIVTALSELEASSKEMGVKTYPTAAIVTETPEGIEITLPSVIGNNCDAFYVVVNQETGIAASCDHLDMKKIHHPFAKLNPGNIAYVVLTSATVTEKCAPTEKAAYIKTVFNNTAQDLDLNKRKLIVEEKMVLEAEKVLLEQDRNRLEVTKKSLDQQMQRLLRERELHPENENIVRAIESTNQSLEDNVIFLEKNKGKLTINAAKAAKMAKLLNNLLPAVSKTLEDNAKEAGAFSGSVSIAITPAVHNNMAAIFVGRTEQDYDASSKFCAAFQNGEILEKIIAEHKNPEKAATIYGNRVAECNRYLINKYAQIREAVLKYSTMIENAGPWYSEKLEPNEHINSVSKVAKHPSPLHLQHLSKESLTKLQEEQTKHIDDINQMIEKYNDVIALKKTLDLPPNLIPLEDIKKATLEANLRYTAKLVEKKGHGEESIAEKLVKHREKEGIRLVRNTLSFLLVLPAFAQMLYSKKTRGTFKFWQAHGAGLVNKTADLPLNLSIAKSAQTAVRVGGP